MNRTKFEVGLIIFYVTSLALNFHNLILNSNEIFFSGDALQHQYWFQLISQTNLIYIDNNIASPVGDSIWSNPQLGLFISVLALVLQDIFHFNSSQGLILVFLILGTINFIFTLKLARIIRLNFVLTTLLSLTIGLSPFYLEKIGALGVAAFYPLIAVIITLISSQTKVYENLTREYFSLFIIIFTASFWWLVLIAAVLVPVLIVQFIYYLIFRNVNSIFKYWLNLFFITYGSLAFYFLLFHQYSRLRGQNRWQPWQSEIFSGKFSDLLLGSPLLTSLVPSFMSSLSGGTSPGAIGDRLGFIQTLGVFFLVFFILIYMIVDTPTKSNDYWIKHLAFIGLVLILFYVTGGFGNLTSGLLILFDQTSPIRAWSRLNVVLSLTGLLILSFYLQKYSSNKVQILVTTAFITFTFADVLFTQKPVINRVSDSMEYQVSKYVSENVSACKILQIPVDTQPIPQDYLNENNGDFYYTGYKQFILNPELSWSFGNWTHSYGWLYEASIPTVLDRKWLNERNENICGVIYDKEFAKWRQISAEDWPGLKVNLGNPSFSNLRYDFYLI